MRTLLVITCLVSLGCTTNIKRNSTSHEWEYKVVEAHQTYKSYDPTAMELDYQAETIANKTALEGYELFDTQANFEKEGRGSIYLFFRRPKK